MVFLIAYALFEVPSNYFLKKLRPSVCLNQSIHIIHSPIITIPLTNISAGSLSSCYPGVQQQWVLAVSTTTLK